MYCSSNVVRGIKSSRLRWVVHLAHVNVIGDDIRTIERNTDVLLNACKDIGLAVNTGKTKYMEIGRNRGMIANAHIKIRSNSYEKVETFSPVLSLERLLHCADHWSREALHLCPCSYI